MAHTGIWALLKRLYFTDMSERQVCFMHTKNKYSWLGHLDFMAVDLLAMIISFIAAYFIKFRNLSFINSPDWLRLILLFSGLNIVIALVKNPYSGILKRSYYMEIIRAMQLTFYNLISVALVLYIFKIGSTYSRAVFIMMYFFYFLLSLLMKYIWKQLVVSKKIVPYNTRPVSLFIISSRDEIESTLTNVAAGDFDIYDVKGLYFTDDDSCEEYSGIPVVSGDFADYIIKNNIDDVLIAVQPNAVSNADYRKLIGNAVNIHISIEAAIGMQTEDQFISEVGIYRTLSVGAYSFTPSTLLYLGLKRLLDFIIGIFGLLILIPVSLIIKAASLLSGDKGSIFYTQKRVGLNGKTIRILKYRTMVKDADKKLKELLKEEKYRREWEENQKLTNDPRITKVGRVLRKLSVDEFPQFINLIKGDMSLVGPRPLVEGELESHEGLKLYQKVKPGMTGWWGCNGRSNIEYRERLELEYYYIKHFSMYLDILCVLRTVFAVLKKDGAE